MLRRRASPGSVVLMTLDIETVTFTVAVVAPRVRVTAGM
jgi:hypothetical protein